MASIARQNPSEAEEKKNCEGPSKEEKKSEGLQLPRKLSRFAKLFTAAVISPVSER